MAGKRARGTGRGKTRSPFAPGQLLGTHQLREEIAAEGPVHLYTTVDQRSLQPGLCTALHSRTASKARIFEERTRLLARVRHPQIAAVLEAGHSAGHPYRITSRGAGEPLDRALWSRLRPGIPERMLQVGSLFLQAALMLEHLHAHGWLHLSLSPRFFRVEQDGHLRMEQIPGLWAQGDLAPDPELDPDALDAPELGSGGSPGVSADLFGLGQLLAAMLTGGEAGAGGDSSHVPVASLNLEGLAPDAPYWTTLCRTLVQDDLGLRPRSVSALIVALQRDAPSSEVLLPDELDVDEGSYSTEPSGVFVEPPFVGCDDSLGAARELLCTASTTGGRHSVIWVGGPPGFGKSRALRELRHVARGFGMVALSGRCSSRTRARLEGFFGILVEAVEWLRKNHPRELMRLPGPVKQALIQTFPVYLDIGDETGTDPPAAPNEAVDALLRRISQHAPVLVTIDDLHLADRTTEGLARRLALRGRGGAGSYPISIATTYDTAVQTAPPAWVPDQAQLGPRRLVIRMAPIGVPEVAQVLGALLGAPTSTDNTFVRRLAVRTGGIPGLLMQVLKHLAEAGALPVSGASATRASRNPAKMLAALDDLPRPLVASLQHWLGSIPHEHQQVLRALSQSREAMPIRALARQSGLELERTLMALTEMRAAALVTTRLEEHEQYAGIAVPLIRQVLSGEAPDREATLGLSSLEESLDTTLGPTVSILDDSHDEVTDLRTLETEEWTERTEKT